MTEQTHPDTGYQARVTAALEERGFSSDVAESLLAFDSAMFQWHRMKAKGEVPVRLMQAVGLRLEASQFHALTALTRIECGTGRAAPEPATVGLLAEEMAIDPSRASRIAADLIEQGLVRREADQADGRRTILKLTDGAVAALEAIRALKWSKLTQAFAGWEDDDIHCFSRLFVRYVAGIQNAYGLRPPQDPDGK